MKTYYTLDDLSDVLETKSEQEASDRCNQWSWFACNEPERPVDRSTRFHDRCAGCMVGATAAMERGDISRQPEMIETMRSRLEEHGEAER